MSEDFPGGIALTVSIVVTFRRLIEFGCGQAPKPANAAKSQTGGPGPESLEAQGPKLCPASLRLEFFIKKGLRSQGPKPITAVGSDLLHEA